ncbi:MAG: GGDEF domain-containing protein [Terricaulis sp.]|nr:GGDEF domain-containing protein [Terricaulis sp.]
MENNAAMQGPDGPSIAQEAIDLMRLHGVPPSGPNYQVWLTYRLGAHRPLCEAIDARISGAEGFTEEFNKELYERFFTGLGASAQIVLAGEKIARDLGHVVSFLRATEEKSGDYGRTLESAATHLDRGVGPEQIRQIVSSLAAATLDMASHNHLLSEQLQRSTREVESLRKSLETVRVESLTDSLTGLANRRMFDETLRLRMSEARAQNLELSLILVDIDHFKRSSTTLGAIIRAIRSSVSSPAPCRRTRGQTILWRAMAAKNSP